MQKTKCAYCKWHKVGGVWLSECTCPNSDYEFDECVEQIGAESEDCDCKVEA